MAKRVRDDSEEHAGDRTVKRPRPSTVDRLSRLSDELILRVLSYLPVDRLVVCQRLSHKYRTLAGDNQLWKQRYYEQFVQPRAVRLPAWKESGMGAEGGSASLKTSRWLADEHLVRRGVKTNWKRQYKLKHNWTKGSAAVNEIPVSEQATVPPVLVQMHEGVIYMADAEGLRAWSAKGDREMVARGSFPGKRRRSPPTALAIDAVTGDHHSNIVVGFEDGAFDIYILDQDEACFHRKYSHADSSNGVISAVAISWPYVTTMTATQLLSLYRFPTAAGGVHVKNDLAPPRLLHSLKSHNVWPPLSTALRTTESSITISVAYALPTYLSGWTVGLQEVKVSPEGDLLDSRLASAIHQHYRPLAFSVPPMMQHLLVPTPGTLATSTTLELRHIHSKPTSLSYTHPYLLVSHPDNTLTLYLVTSTADVLSISAGTRLWGHTSSVSGATVGGRGKAVSVSKRGDELRVWELEGGFASSAAKRRLAGGELSVRVQSERVLSTPIPTNTDGAALISHALSARNAAASACAVESRLEDDSELTLTRGWVGFDEENVCILKERSQGRQALVVYDFT